MKRKLALILTLSALMATTFLFSSVSGHDEGIFVNSRGGIGPYEYTLPGEVTRVDLIARTPQGAPAEVDFTIVDVSEGIEILGVNDGAAWIWNVTGTCNPDLRGQWIDLCAAAKAHGDNLDGQAVHLVVGSPGLHKMIWTAATEDGEVSSTAWILAGPLLVGDVDCSGTVTASDALAVLKLTVGLGYMDYCPRYTTNWSELHPEPNFDVNNDLVVSAVDALAVLRITVQLE